MLKAEAKKELTEALGREGFQDSREELICYSYDATAQEYMPEAVVYPRNVQQVSRVMQLAGRHGFKVIPRGAGSGVTGGSLPVEGGVVMVMTHFDRILEIDTDNLLVIVEPNVVTSHLHSKVEELGLFYPPDPGSVEFSSIGGNIAENAGGMRAVKYGVTKDYVLGLEVVLPDGQIVHTGSKCLKDVVGYNLTQLFVGSEGTLGIITQATLKLLPLPEGKQTLTASYASLHQAGSTVSELVRRKIVPTTIEFLDKNAIWTVEQYLHLGLPSNAGGFLLIEVDGDQERIGREISKVEEICHEQGALEVKVAKDSQAQQELWRARRSVAASIARFNPLKKLDEDIAVPRSRIPEFIDAAEDIASRHDVLMINFGHAGDGNIHTIIIVQQEPASRGDKALEELFRKTVELEGRITGEHGIGCTKKRYIGWNLDQPTLALMRKIKDTLDPQGILNPGKIFPD